MVSNEIRHHFDYYLSKTGAIRFSPTKTFRLWASRDFSVWDDMRVGDLPVLRDIKDVDLIYHLVSEQRVQAVVAAQVSRPKKVR